MTQMHRRIEPDISFEPHAALDTYYGALGGRDLLEPLIERIFPGRIALVSSFGAESAVLLHMVAAIDRTLPVIFLNTGKLFGETLAYRESLAERFGLSDVRDIRPDPLDTARLDPAGDLWNTDIAACCGFRKVLPLQRALAGFSAWITGRKQFQSSGRASLNKFESDFPRIKINPLADWPAQRMAAYVVRHNLPVHPLVAQGYSSIGCAPCTSPVRFSDDARAGRWRGSEQTECGIHIAGGQILRAANGRSGKDESV